MRGSNDGKWYRLCSNKTKQKYTLLWPFINETNIPEELQVKLIIHQDAQLRDVTKCNLLPSRCEKAAEAVFSTPHSCLTTQSY